MISEKFTFFWNGPFSQWHSSPFTFEKMRFNRAEQFMMFCKAMYFEDRDTARAIMKSNNPKEQKTLGRGVKNFNIEAWANVAKDIVYAGSYLKYSQNINLKDLLLETNGSTLVEASPYDKIWGIGLAEDNPNAADRSKWQGKNWLGEVLTQTRHDLMSNNKNEKAFDLCAMLIKKYKNG